MSENTAKLVEQVASDALQQPVSAVESSPRGQISEAWFFTAADKDYVIRFARPGLGYTLRKDRYVAEVLLSPDIPVAKFVHVDRHEDRTFAITERVPGVMLDSLSDDAFDAMVPSLIETLDRIHQTPLTGSSGSGGFDHRGVGRTTSWSAHLLAVGDSDPGGFYGDWHHLFDDTFLERDFFESVYEQMKALLPYCPEERYLVHGDYGFDNMIVRDGKIVAVLDWANATFGDFLWDVAWLGICKPDRDLVSDFKKYYAHQGRRIPHIDERLNCYYCHIGLDTLRFYAATNQQDAYAWMKSNLERLGAHSG